MSGDFLFQAVIYLCAAVVCVPIAKKFGLSSVLGYLLAGIIIGPYLLGFIGEEGEDILHFAEFGVVMMLFLIGLEIEPKAFWSMRKTILGLGGAQVAITVLLCFGLLTGLGYSWQSSLSISMALALSSTAIVLQTLKEKNLMDTVYGASSFSILLFQDIIVIPMLAIVPLLGSVHDTVTSDGHDSGHVSLLNELPIGLQTVFVLLSVVLVVLAGRYLFVPVLRVVAKTRLRELFSASALLIVMAIAYLMELVGLSPALGAFLGGVVLATSEFKHELESNLEPFKGLLLGLFFIAVGASINFTMIIDNPTEVTLMVLGVVFIKGIVLYLVASIFKIQIDQKLLIAIGLAQVGEFAFVLLSFASQFEILSQNQLDLFLVVTAISMTLAPFLSIFNERFILPKIGTKESVDKPMDTIDKQQKVILVGFGHFGSTVGRFLRANSVHCTILDHDSNRVDLLRKLGFEVYYGDATREDLLESAGAHDADLLISAIDDPEATLTMIEMLKHNFPNLELMVRAKSRVDAYQLLNAGVNRIYRESLDTSVRLGADALQFLGHRKYTAHRQAQNFKKYDENSLRRLADKVLNSDEYIFKAREEIAQQEALLQEDLKRGELADVDTSWDSETLRDSIKKGAKI
ncbi:MAG: monovalent cation:proton antiporter-2 (CPA2) family protein [Cytophagales bacterium]|nr:monovalent cation:proton antiporter-2 (CPA2) family protein [Cytophagales bacterium]